MAGVSIKQTSSAEVEVISAYSAPNTFLAGVAATPGWHVVGSFFVALAAEDVRLEAIGIVSDASLRMRVRLFDLKDLEVLDGSLTILESLVDARATSGLFDLPGARTYQIQAEVIGGAGDTLFGVLKSATLI